jgi:uncharacterized ubiquitin-like protein YukD
MENKTKNQNFDYFDQFSDFEIDLTKYLEYYSTSDYTLKFSNLQPTKTTIKNLFDTFAVTIDYAKNRFSLFEYEILEGELPSYVSYKNFNTNEFWWLIFLLNNIKNPFTEWPLTQVQLNEYTEMLYRDQGKYSKEFYYQYLFTENEKKRVIKLPYQTQLIDVISQFRKAILDREIG